MAETGLTGRGAYYTAVVAAVMLACVISPVIAAEDPFAAAVAYEDAGDLAAARTAYQKLAAVTSGDEQALGTARIAACRLGAISAYADKANPAYDDTATWWHVDLALLQALVARAEKGDAYAQLGLGSFYDDHPCRISLTLAENEKLIPVIAAWYKKSADQKLTRAEIKLADLKKRDPMMPGTPETRAEYLDPQSTQSQQPVAKALRTYFRATNEEAYYWLLKAEKEGYVAPNLLDAVRKNLPPTSTDAIERGIKNGE